MFLFEAALTHEFTAGPWLQDGHGFVCLTAPALPVENSIDNLRVSICQVEVVPE